MIGLLNRFGSSLWSAAAVVIGVLLFALKFMVSSRARWKEKAQAKEAELEFRDDVEEADEEIDAEYSDLERDLEREKQAVEWPSNLRKGPWKDS